MARQKKNRLPNGTTVYRRRVGANIPGIVNGSEVRTRKNRETIFYEILWNDGFTTWEPRSQLILERNIVNV